jgi:hypothetical protein
MALSFPQVDEEPHFHLASFRVKKKIFSTLWEKEKRAMLKLSLTDQSVFCTFDTAVFYPVPGAWGKQGATFVDLGKVKTSMLKDALDCAYHFLVEKSGTKKSMK